MAPDDATRRQIAAASPATSTWLAANAGSGKTRVLTDRVARLLLDGVSPQHILCLTYTRAAASEMQNRLFRRLGEWAMQGDDALRASLSALGHAERFDQRALSRARTLFARAIDTPGGLRIQTIHSFCASLLRRFPIEAGVSPFFTEMDERAARLLQEEVVEQIAEGADAEALRAVADHFTGEDFPALVQQIVRHRNALGRAREAADIWRMFALPQGYGRETLRKETFLPDDPALIAELVAVLEAEGSKNDRKAAVRLQELLGQPLGVESLDVLIPVLLTGPSAKSPFSARTGSFPTKALREAHPGLTARLNHLMRRVEAARARRNALLAAERTLALQNFATVFLDEYEARKRARGLLDFDDLITATRRLLEDRAAAQWVLFRLDGGIDHILVDEAQDTSPEQWQLVRLLAGEFTAGEGARPGVRRTLFVVGDLKQSIYSFQGADPRAFDEMRSHFSAAFERAGEPFQELSLDHSFRSSPAILQLVDAVFAHGGGRGVGGPTRHIAHRQDLPGRVDLWPVIPPQDGPEDRAWYDPQDMLAANDHRVILARTIAGTIRDMVKTGSVPGENGDFRPVRYGDFLILVQRRSDLFHEIIRACKALGLPIAGADRLRIGGEMAVKDLTALLSFLATPEDDLSLAAVLRSPLFGLSEQDLFTIAHARPKGGLWPALTARRADFPQACEVLSDLRDHADFLGPFDLLERILTRHDGRRRLLARLGTEAEEGIDALLSQALAFERTEVPSLTGFLAWLEGGEVEVRRQPEGAGDRIRVMTTHGAKGLESEIVILPDTADLRPGQGDELLVGNEGVIWRPPAALRPPLAEDLAARQHEAREEERMRLLYVALTRARKWLIVCASGEVKEEGGSWYRTVEAGMRAAGAKPFDSPAGQGLRLQHGQWRAAAPEPATAPAEASAALPRWAGTPAPAPVEPPRPLAPSALGGDKALAGGETDEEAALRRGRIVHALLEHLPSWPEDAWPDRAGEILTLSGESLSGAEAEDIVKEAINLLKSPELETVFAADALAEVDLSATLPELGGQRIHGTVDRLVVGPERVLAVDFKSNSIVPQHPGEVPPGILRQMAAYHAALSLIYPDRPVECAIVWTRTARLMPLPHDIMRQSLRVLTTS